MYRPILYLFLLLMPVVNYAQELKLVLPGGHNRRILNAKFANNKKFIISCAADNTVRIWESTSGHVLKTFLLGDMPVYCTLSENGKYVLALESRLASGKKVRVLVWDLLSQKLLFQKECDEIEPKFSKNDALLALSIDKQLVVFSTNNFKEVFRKNVGDGAIETFNFSKNGYLFLNYFISTFHSKDYILLGKGPSDGFADIFRIKGTSFQKVKHIENEFGEPYYSPAGDFVITASSRSKNDKYIVEIWNAETGELDNFFETHTEKISYVDVSRDGHYILTSSVDGTAKMWELTSGELIREFRPKEEHYDLPTMNYAAFSPDGEFIFGISDFKNGIVWDVRNGEVINRFPASAAITNLGKRREVFSDNSRMILNMGEESMSIHDIISNTLISELKNRTEISSSIFNGNYLALKTNDGKLKIWDLESGLMKANLAGLPTPGKWDNDLFVLTASGKMLAYTDIDSNLIVWDIHNGVPLVRMPNNYMIPVSFSEKDSSFFTDESPSFKFNITTGKWDSLGYERKELIDAGFIRYPNYESHTYSNEITDIRTKKTIAELKHPLTGRGLDIHSLEEDPLGRWLLATVADSMLMLVDLKSGNKPRLLTHFNDESAFAAFCNNGKYIVGGSIDGEVRIWETEGLKLVHRFKETGSVSNIVISADERFAYVVTRSNTIGKWNLATNKRLGTIVPIGDGSLTVLPDNYYWVSKNILNDLLFDYKGINYSFDQFDLQLNRPDIVLKSMGNRDTALIRAFETAYRKRLSKMKVVENARFAGKLPTIKIVNENKIPAITENAMLPLVFEIRDSSASLASYSIVVNDVPVYGMKGKRLPQKDKNTIHDNLQLSNGFNKIQLYCTNNNGMQSLRQSIYINYYPKKVENIQRVFFVGIGMDEFADKQYNLQYSTKDVRDLYLKLKERYKDSLVVDTLFNKNVSVASVQALKTKLLTSHVNDIVLLFYSGHGLLSDSLDYFLSTYDIDFMHPKDKGLPYDVLESLLDSIPARKKMMLIDACHSGEVDKETSAYINTRAAKMKLAGGKGTQGLIINISARGGLYNSFEIMQELFVNIGQSTGASVIAAAGGNQFALEGVNNLPNGIFTHCILEAIASHPSMTTSEFKKLIVKQVEELTQGLQKPTVRNEAVGMEWRVW
ncbi:MAG: caspase family protein [Ferruginibacter sp.]